MLAEVDNAAARLEKIRYRDHSESSIRDSYDEYGGYGSSYGYSQSEDNKSTGPDYNLEVSRHDDEYDEMLEQLQSQVNSLDTESDTESRSVYSAQSSNKHDTLRRQSTDLSQDLHNVKVCCTSLVHKYFIQHAEFVWYLLRTWTSLQKCKMSKNILDDLP